MESMIKFEGRAVDKLYEVYRNDPIRREMTMHDWLLEQSKELGIKRIYKFDYILVFDTEADEIVFRLKFGI